MVVVVGEGSRVEIRVYMFWNTIINGRMSCVGERMVNGESERSKGREEDVCFDYWMRRCLIEGDDWWINPSNYAFPSFRLNCHCQHNESLMTTLCNSRANPPNQIKSALPLRDYETSIHPARLLPSCVCLSASPLYIYIPPVIIMSNNSCNKNSPSKDKLVTDYSCWWSCWPLMPTRYSQCFAFFPFFHTSSPIIITKAFIHPVKERYTLWIHDFLHPT